MSVIVQYKSQLEVTETITQAGVSLPSLKFDGYTTRKSLNASTSVPVTKHASFSKAMTAGAATIDFAALVGINGAAVNATGLKLQVAKFRNPSANDITIVAGASNGYLLFGAAGSVVLKPGMEILLYGNETLPDVGGSAKTIDISGTLAQTLDVQLVFG